MIKVVSFFLYYFIVNKPNITSCGKYIYNISSPIYILNSFKFVIVFFPKTKKIKYVSYE